MAKRNFLVDIDLGKNQLVQARIENRASAPTLVAGDAGYIYFNTSDSKYYGWTGTIWIDLGQQITLAIISAFVAAASTKAVPVDADQMVIIDSTDSGIKRMTWANIKTALNLIYQTIMVKATGAEIDTGTEDTKFVTAKAIRDSNLISASVANEFTGVTDKATPVDADILLIEDSAASFAKKKLSWANIKSVMATYVSSVTMTLTNKTFNAEGTGNALSNVTNTHIKASAAIAESKLALDFGTSVLNTAITNHVSNSTGAHAATAIANAPSGNLAATTVQAALNELQGDIDSINTVAAGALIYKGGYNSATNTPMLDVTPIGGIKQGHTYVVTASGPFFTEEVQPGDMLIALQDNPTLMSHWTYVNKNIPDIMAATEVLAGVILLATQAETDTGTNDTKAVTPLKLRTTLGITGTLSVAKKFTTTIGNGVALTYAVTHNIGTLSTVSEIYRNSSPWDEVECEVVKTSTNVTTFNFNVAPTANQYTVVIVG